MKKILAFLFCLLPSIASAQIVGTLPFQLQNGTTADATQVMADFNKILADTNANAAHNGVNADITSLTALITPITPTQGGSSIYTASVSTGTANAQIIASPTPTGFTLATGRRITFTAGFTNTGATQINVNGTGLKDVFRPTPSGPIALAGGEIVAANYIEAVYDGTQYQLYTNASTPGPGPLTSLASAATTDLGTIPSHNVNITGVATITSFGSTAVLTYPTYQLKFASAATLTQSASLLLPNSTSILTAASDIATATYLGSGNWQVTSYTRASGASPSQIITVTLLTAASGTYTTPANVRWIDIKMVGGGGGGGGGQNAGAAGTGGTTCMALSGAACSTPILSVTGGVGGSANGPGTGGATFVGASSYSSQIGTGGGSSSPPGAGYNAIGGTGGSSCVGGGNIGSSGSNTAPNAPSNSGGGAGGGGATNGTLVGEGGSGGGAGGCLFALINNPVATYTYAIGTGGTAGAAGSSSSSAGGAGGIGGSGRIEVTEHY